ncbi:reelin domain-containing protein 1 [Echeneis naucrates]|uniref:reelin domain-containing protein 1 n=1 Tax=Echeneis naucrates TaxID=173247 RepID=UPI0011135BB3|nr:reelin domain-containing protein 1 [Echeneis naucrates]
MQSVLYCFAVGVVLLMLAPPTASFSHGASTTSCQEMIPGHIQAQPQDLRHSHVTLRTSASSYLPGQLVTVTVRSSRDFMGFLLQARSSTRVGMGPVGGSWPLMPPGTHTLRCLSEGDTLTHSDKQLKRNLSFVWRAPDAPKGDIRFYITVVQSYFVYWAGIESAVVRDGTRGLWHVISSTERPVSALQENITAHSALQQRNNKSAGHPTSKSSPTQSSISVETVNSSMTSASLISPKTPLSVLSQEAGTDTENPVTSFSLSNHFLRTFSSPSADKEVTTDSFLKIKKLNVTTPSPSLPSTVSRPHQKDAEVGKKQIKLQTKAATSTPSTNYRFDQTNLPRPPSNSPGELIQDRTTSVSSQPRRSSPAESFLHLLTSSSPRPFPSDPPLQSHSNTDRMFLSSETSALPFQTDLSESQPATGPSGLKAGLKQTTPPHPYHKTAPSSLPRPITPQTQTDAPEASPVSSQTQPHPSSPTSEWRQTTSLASLRFSNLAPTFTPDDSNEKNLNFQIKSQTTNPHPAFFPSPPPPPPPPPSGPTLHPSPSRTSSPSSIIQTPTLVSIQPSLRSTLFTHFSSSSVENQPKSVPALSVLPSPSPISTPPVKPSTYPETSSNSSIYPPSTLTPSSMISFPTIPSSLVTLPASSSPSAPLFGSSSSFSVSPADQRPSAAAPLPSIYNSPGPSSSAVPSQKLILIQSHMAPSDPEPSVTPTPKRAVVHAYPNPEPHPNLDPNFKLNLGHDLKSNVPNSDSKPKRPPNPPGTPDKEGKYPDVTPRHSAWELGMLLGCSAGLGMLLVVGVRYIYRQACGKQTEVTLNARERERGLIHVQECGDLVRVRKIRENSFVLLAEYDILTSPGD